MSILLYIGIFLLWLIGIVCLFFYARGLRYSNPLLSGWYMGWTQLGFFSAFLCSTLLYSILIKSTLLMVTSGILSVITLIILIKRVIGFIRTPKEEKNQYKY